MTAIKQGMAVTALFCGALLTGPALAQDPPPPPDQDTVSATGVSLVSGGYSTSSVDLKIGTGDFPQALVLERGYSSSLNKNHGNIDGLTGWGWTASTVMWISVGELGGGDYPPDQPPPDQIERYPWRYGIVEGADTLASFVEQDPISDPTAGPNYEGPFQRWTSTGMGSLVRTGDDLIFTAGDGTKHYFEGGTRQTFRDNVATFRTRMEAPDGTILTFHGDLGSDAVFSNRGMAILFEFDSDGKTWTKACTVNLTVHQVTPTSPCPAGVPTVTYEHAAIQAGNRRLNRVLDPLGKRTLYQYSGDDQLRCIKLPGQSECQISNSYTNCLAIPNEPADGSMNAHQQVYRQELITGEVVTYDFDIQRYCPLKPPGSGQYSAPYSDDITMTYSDGSTKMVRASYEGLPLLIRDGIGRETTMIHGIENFANRPEKLTAVIAPDGNRWLYAYAGNGLVSKTTVRSKNSGDPDLVWDTSYGTCNQPVRQTDARGNVTDIVYSSVHCGIRIKTLPADQNGVRPETRYGYQQKYAWTKSGSGFVRAASPVWVLTREEYCRTSSADANGNCAAGAADEVVTTYEYQEGSATKGSNIWLVGTAVTADGQTRRSCISYDDYGRKVSETSPRANLASCQ